MLDGAKQLPHLEPISIQRMSEDIIEAAAFIKAPGYAAARDQIVNRAQATHARPADPSAADDLRKELRQLKHRLINDENIIYTVVFMPYHASMWDSLHTIWAAARADPRVETIVVPIPYADRLPDGTAGAWHVHTAGLPPEVTVTPHTEFDLAATHPDVIYVHNPYDGNNLVTSVDPRFYSAELRPHTDLLVYIPYYVSTATPGEHLYRSPAFTVFDKVIAQSETVDQPMIEQWSSSKVVPLGSPKFDYVRTVGSPVPDDWHQRLNNRTVLLQVTSLGALLESPDAVIQKLNEVLDAVEVSHDMALWWRPHPLERATVTSMLSRVEALYTAYATRAARSDRVVVDTSWDLQRAIYNADAYFGHWSSVTALFGFTGKPMVIQETHVQTNAPRPEGPQDEGPRADLTVYARPEWFAYEGAINRLRRLLQENGGLVPGQQEYFASLTAHADGSAGQHIHDYVLSCLGGE